jgi:putative transposase
MGVTSDYESVEELVNGLREYFDFYNNERPHQSFGGSTPSELYWGMCNMKKAA